jgi:small ligand-binding sensory domain FIST
MPFAAALSTLPQTTEAVAEASATALAALPAPPDLALLFFSPHHLASSAALLEEARRRLQPRCLLGCVGETIIGNGHEVERGPALSLWLGKWPAAVELEPFHLALERTGEGLGLIGWPDALLAAEVARSALLVLGDPFTFPPDLFLRSVNEDQRGLPVLGGMASGIRGPGQCRLLLQGRVLDHGAAGVLLQGPIGLRSIVSQGCRPVGRHLVVTRGQDNLIQELGGRPVLDQLRELWEGMTAEERELFQQGPHLGIVINEYQGEFQRGDFLVRNVMGFERETGALAITDRVRVGQTVQFHVRDARTADEDLHALLQLDLAAHAQPPAGALLFSCNGRGTRMFAEPDHDAGVIRAEAGPIPLAGFFAQGELGPVGGQNFIHGFTASIALFE